jgi:hypothetical protein
MSANEVIEQIKALPDREKQQVYAFVLAEKNTNGRSTADDVIDSKTFEQAADAVFAKHGDLLRMLAQ